MDSWKNGRYDRSKGADHYRDMEPGKIILDLREFYKKADAGKWRKYLSDFEKAVKETLDAGK